jgi:hypothetical protein
VLAMKFVLKNVLLVLAVVVFCLAAFEGLTA